MSDVNAGLAGNSGAKNSDLTKILMYLSWVVQAVVKAKT